MTSTEQTSSGQTFTDPTSSGQTSSGQTSSGQTSSGQTSRGTQSTGPTFSSRKPRMNHVAMSLAPDELDEEHRKLRADFLADVFGFYDLPMLTQDRYRQVFQVHNIEQFVFLIADDPPMTCARLDHFGLSVGAESELDEILARAKAWQARDDRVEIVDKTVDDHGMLAITSIYVRYLLPMMIEIQWWDFKGMARADEKGGA